mmetsp:Transcript_61289/g.85258  ORF Transcript_61289/g.85258 Transcript_61289/m.85258 type:complete len:250 (-) Transcript_61289:648-1397(-)
MMHAQRCSAAALRMHHALSRRACGVRGHSACRQIGSEGRGRDRERKRKRRDGERRQRRGQRHESQLQRPSVPIAVHQLFDPIRCIAKLASSAIEPVQAIVVEQGIRGHVENGHEAQGHSASDETGSTSHCHRLVDEERRIWRREGGRAGEQERNCGAAEHTEESAEEGEDQRRAVEHRHGHRQLRDHGHGLPGGCTVVTGLHRHVHVGVLVQELNDLSEAVQAALDALQHTFNKRIVALLLVRRIHDRH